MDSVELVRLLRSGESDRRITHLLGHYRRTIAKYRESAVAHGLLDGPLPLEGERHSLLARTIAGRWRSARRPRRTRRKAVPMTRRWRT